MAVDYATQTKSLLADATLRSTETGEQFLREMDHSAVLLLAWIGYLLRSSTVESPKVLLSGAQAAAVEAAGCVSLGLVRPALFSMRAQIDMMMAWMYFHEHPVEWRYARSHAGEGKLRGEVIKYLGTYFQRFRERYKLLAERRTRREEEPYGILSAHVHSLTPATVPTLAGISSLVSDPANCAECVVLQFSVAEYLNDVCLAVYADRWVDLPDDVRQAAQNRLSRAQMKELTKT